MFVHVNIAPVHDQMLIKEGLSRASLARVHRMSLALAEKIHALGLSRFEGSIMVFEDSDVVAIFQKQAAGWDDTLAKLRSEFTRNGLMHIFSVEEMSKKLSSLITFSEEKQIAAENYRIKRRAIEIGEHLNDWSEPDLEITRAIHKKRRARQASCILIIEDDQLTRGLVNSLLKDEHQVVQAKDAETGIIAYIDHAPNVVFLDIHLPGLDGRETLKRLMQLDRDAYVVMLSADSATDNILSTHSNGAAGFIRKPFSKEKILEYIAKCPTLEDTAIRALGWSRMKNYLKE